MKQWQVDPRGNDGLALVEVDAVERLSSREVRIKMEATCLNFRDQLLLSGRYPVGEAPVVPLSDGAGEVIGIGDGVTRVALGDRVVSTTITNWVDGDFDPEMQSESLGFTVDGWLAEEIIVPETGLVKIPKEFSFEAASTLPCAGVTAWNAIIENAGIGPGDKVLTLGTGGVSMFAVQLAKMVGAEAFVTSSSDSKLERARALGANVGVNYRTHPKWDERIRELTSNHGVDLVIENAGTLRQSVNATRYGGMVAVIGMLAMLTEGSSPPNNDLGGLLRTGVTVKPIMMGNRRMLSRLVQAYVRHEVEPVIEEVFPFNEAPAAYRALSAANHMGNIVISRG